MISINAAAANPSPELAEKRPAFNLFLGLAHQMGLRNQQRFGDSTGTLAEI